MTARRRALAVVALAALLAVAPAVGYTGVELVVGSQHTTAADFERAQELSNLTVNGEGEDGYVALGAEFSDGFEFEPADSGVPERWERVTDPAGEGYSRSADIERVSTDTAASGSQSYYLNESQSGNVLYSRPDGQPITPSTGNVSAALYQPSTSSFSETTVQLYESTGAPPSIDVGIYEGDLVYINNSGRQTISTEVTEQEWVAITIHDIDPASDTYSVTWSSPSDSGTTTGLSMQTPLSDGYTSSIIQVNNDAYIDDFQTGGGGQPTAGKYVSPLHNVTDAETAAINITQAANVSVDATIRTDTDTVLNQTTLSATGNHTLPLAESSSDQLETVLEINATGTNPVFTLDDESILFSNHAPSVDNSTASPTGALPDSSVTLSIDASDPTFDTVQGDEVTATFYVKPPGASSFQADGTDTITTNGTVSSPYTASSGGTYEWYVKLNDTYGGTATSQTQTFSAPGELAIRQETQPNQLVTSANVNITYYYGGSIQRANTSDGTVNLTGLPIDEPIIALADAPGYHSRTAVIPSIYEQESLYLLNDSLSSHELIFDLTDPTGSYPRADTVLLVQRDINLSGTTDWRTVTGDNFGAQGVVTDLQAGERYRLVIQNLDTGDRSTLGAFTPVASREVTLEAASASVNISAESDTAIGYDASRNDDGDAIIVEYVDPGQSTDRLKFMIHERHNESNVLLTNQTYTDLGNLSHAQPLSASEQNTSWAVDFYWDRGDGYTHGRAEVGSGPRDLVPDVLDRVWRVSVGVLVLILTALLFSELNLGVGAITTSLTGGLLWYAGLLEGVTTGPAIVISFAVAGVIHYSHRGGP